MSRPTARVLALLDLLQTGRVFTVKELATRLDVDERTVRRYIGHLADLEIPVETIRGRYGGYRIGAGHRLPPLMLTENEAVVTMVSLTTAVHIGLQGETEATETAVSKIRRVLPAALERRVRALLETSARPVAAAEDGTAASPVLLTVAEAAYDHRPLDIEYRNRSDHISSRTILPWGIVAHGGNWYVTGPDLSSGQLRTFRIDRIQRVEVAPGHFTVPEQFDPTRQVQQSLSRTPWRYEVSLLVRATDSRIRSHLPANVAEVRDAGAEAPSGKAAEEWRRVRLRAERLDWVAAAIVSIDAPFIINSPAELSEAVTALINRTAERLHRPEGR
ncbi:helix-turn-helix transcriptional regulator [Leifsonia sp. AG29]|uniref:helix-turn-helix transcriptional regulator n=1 Tax=Leifsonia sp. AG29 TaxID=2598860 RepID=UPI00131DE9A5|nr:YafY family protein [Leifsonia sp. AG29]